MIDVAEVSKTTSLVNSEPAKDIVSPVLQAPGAGIE